MAEGSDDSRQHPAPNIDRGRTSRPGAEPRSVTWPETGGMQAHSQAANRMFKTNSTKLQKNQAARDQVKSKEIPNQGNPEPSIKVSAKRLEKGDYAGLRLETAKAQGKTRQHEKPQIEEGKLTFARDRKKPEMDKASEKRELKDGELSFSRSRLAHDPSRGR